MAEHTKGPWSVVPARGYEKRGWVEVVDHRNRPVVGVDSFERHSCDESECHHGVRITPEDARLIASAPDLLEALERLADVVKDYAEYHGPSEDHHPDDCPDDDCQGCAMDLSVNGAVNAARAAIAKARGTR